MKASNECDPDGIRVECACEYHVLWAGSSISTAGKREKTVRIASGGLKIKKPLYIRLSREI